MSIRISLLCAAFIFGAAGCGAAERTPTPPPVVAPAAERMSPVHMAVDVRADGGVDLGIAAADGAEAGGSEHC